MPYIAKGLWVMVKRGGRWVRLKKHSTPQKAKAHASALNINVSAKEN
jgi:hypothetical protein